jgi:hypothetical protein
MRRLTSAALAVASRSATCSNAWTDDLYETSVTAVSGTTESRRKAIMRRVLNDMWPGLEAV